MNNFLSLDSYQERASTFVIPGVPNEERVLGIVSEAGEVAGVFQKLIRGDYPPEEAQARLHKELGDVLFYVSQVALDNDWKLSDIAQGNIDKLTSRKARSVLRGDGDQR